jgi:hypothetical protein
MPTVSKQQVRRQSYDIEGATDLSQLWIHAFPEDRIDLPALLIARAQLLKSLQGCLRKVERPVTGRLAEFDKA